MATSKKRLGKIEEQLEGLAVPIEDLHPDPANARKHGEKNLEAIKASLHAYGQRKPIVVQRKGMIVRAGNGTMAAAKALGWTHLAAVVIDEDNATAAQYAIADNRTGELAEWNEETLASLLDGMDDAARDALAFDEADMAELMKSLEPDAEIVEDEVPPVPDDPITKPGDLWILGRHRVLCGDSTKAEDVARLMDGARSDLCFTSPPYGKQRDYTEECMAKLDDWDGLMRGVFENLPMADDGQVLVNLGMIHRDGEWLPYWDGWIAWMREHGWRRFGWYVWDQGSGLPGDWNGRLGPSHEFVFHFNRESTRPQKWVNCDPQNTLIGKRATEKRKAGGSVTAMRGKNGKVKKVSSTDRNAEKIPDSVIRISRCATIDMAREHHPATFPIQLPAFAIRSWPGMVYEPFCGSGTTMIAAEQLGSTCYGMELSPAYCDVIVKRWENLTGKVATRG